MSVSVVSIKMIEEIIGIVVSTILTVFGTPEAPIDGEENLLSSQDADLQDHIMIHTEYEVMGNGINELDHISFGSTSQRQKTFCRSFWRSIRANISILSVIFPLLLIMAAYLYFLFNTTYLCFNLMNRNHTTPFDILTWKVVGENIEDFLLNLWFPASMVILFGWSEFNSHHRMTLYIAFVSGVIVVIYKDYLVMFRVDFTKHNFYRYPINGTFFVALLSSAFAVAKKIRMRQPEVVLTTFQILTMILFQFTSGFIYYVVFTYVIAPYFNGQKSVIKKAVIASIAPSIAFIPIGVARYFVIRHSVYIVKQERSFVLVYILRGSVIAVYRIMQGSFNSLWVFTGISLLHAVTNLAAKATEKLREQLWTRFIDYLRKFWCCRMLERANYDTPHNRRLKADIEIQDIIFDYATLVLVQCYVVFFQISETKVMIWPLLKESSLRIAINIGIEFCSNIVAVFIQIHWCNIPIRRVWLMFWKRHLFANCIILLVIVCSFTNGLLSVLQTRLGNSEVLRNCSMPFSR